MTCEICGMELNEDTTSTVDENKCSMCAPDFDNEDGEGEDELNMNLDDDNDMDMEL